MQRINNKVFLSTEEIERWIPTDNGIHDNSVEPLSRFNVNGYENLERANQGSKERERERERIKLDPRRTRMSYQITTHPLPFFPLPTSSWQTRPRGCLAAGPTMGKTLQLY